MENEIAQLYEIMYSSRISKHDMSKHKHRGNAMIDNYPAQAQLFFD
jgi:hypothetical protein